MKKSIVSSLLAVGLVALGAGCGGGGGEGPAAGEGAPSERSVQPGTSGAPGPTGQAGVPVGIQPVPNTPVETVPDHPGHEPLTPTSPGPVELPTAPLAKSFTREWWVSPSGNDGAAGTQEAPFQSINHAIRQAGPGEVVHVMAGTYAEKVDIGEGVREGTPEQPITLQGEGRPVLVPGSGDRGGLIDIRRPYWVVDGFEIDVKKQPRYAVTFQGNVQGSVLANSELHSGAFGGGITTFDSADGAIIENNHIHDFSRGNDDSHGIVVQPTSRNITIRYNDIHDNSGDSVQCIGPEGFSNLPPAEGVVIEHNHMFDNRENAVDIKTCYGVKIRHNRMHGFRTTSSAKGDALVVHYSARDVEVEDNDIFDSGTGIGVGGNREGPAPSGVVVRRNRIHDIVKEGGTFGHGIRVENSNGIRVEHNTVTRTAGPGLVIGQGTGGPTTNGTFVNNIVATPELVKLGEAAPGLKMSGNLYAPEGSFQSGSGPVDFAGWKAMGVDVTSEQADPGLQGPGLAPGPNAVDRGEVVEGEQYCGAGPDVGAVEADCQR